jgi:hypothetical protein
MAICPLCDQELLAADVTSCAPRLIVLADGKLLEPVLHFGAGRCADCNVAPGGIHHANCQHEACPKCGAQLITCPCRAQYVPQP